MSLGSLILSCTNWSQLTFVTSTVTWAWADREAARAKIATKATQTHFRGIRLSSQEIAILAKRPIACTDSVNRLEDRAPAPFQRRSPPRRDVTAAQPPFRTFVD